jgi:dipeptidyl aminopeptidase/acylaminoacyl peptidase
MIRRSLSIFVYLLAGLALAVEKRPLTVDDMWAVQRVGSPVLSPDGKTAAYTVTAYDMEENRGNADIWLVPVLGGPPRRLTSNKASDTSPAWSPDGRRIAFISKRDDDKAAQIYVISVDGGEAERVTDMPLGASGPRWFPDGKRIAFVSRVVAGAESPAETKKALEAREKNKVKARVSESRLVRFWDRWLTDNEYPHIFTVDVASRKVTDLLPGSKRYFELLDGSGDFDISPDGAWVAFAANSAAEPYRTLNQDVFLVPSVGGDVKNLTADNPADDKTPVFSPDGKSIAYGLERKDDGWPDYTRLAVKDLASGKTTVLTEGWENGAGRPSWSADGRALVFTAEARARTNIYAEPIAGGAPRLVWKGGRAAGVQLAPAGQVVFSYTTLDRPPELASVGLDGTGFRTLTSVNDALMAKVDLGKTEELTFRGAAGDEVQMFVVYPPGFDPARKYPLVQMIHGGPIGTFGDDFGFRWNAHAFAAPGYVVAMVNFHGSSSFGQKWVESILGAHADKPFEDVMKATDVLVKKGSVDTSRMAAAGGSYGGFLVDWIAGHTDRFKALVSHAGVYDLLGQSASDAGWGRQWSYGGYPFTNLENVERQSPNRFAKNFVTPMLVIHNDLDYRVPMTQGLELYGVLTAKGVPARLVSYPDENHWVLKPQNSKHWYGEVLGWLARWLK